MIVGEVVSRGMEDNTQIVEADDEEIFSYKMAGLRPCEVYTAFIRADKDSFEVPFCKFLCLITLTYFLSYLKLHIMYKMC